MICWSCEGEAGSGSFCAKCGALLPPSTAGTDHFDVLGLPRRYDIDLAATEENFRALARQLHPDRFAKADPRARRASLQRSVQLNEAWRTLKDPVRRAEYLLHQAGYEVGAEDGASRPDAKGGGRERMPVAPELLGEILELREELSDARAAGDEERVRKLASGVRRRLEDSLANVGSALAMALQAPTAASGGAASFEAAARELIAIRYFRRFLEEVAVHDESVAVRDEGAAHA